MLKNQGKAKVYHDKKAKMIVHEPSDKIAR